MACTGFIVITTETLPAGLLPQLAAGLGISEGGAGQLVSAYAIGTVLTAMPAVTLTRGTRRKPLLLAGLLGFLVANAVTAVSPSFTVALVARFVAGAFSGLLWGMLAGYARRIAAPEHAGRALAIAMTGTPVALSGCSRTTCSTPTSLPICSRCASRSGPTPHFSSSASPRSEGSGSLACSSTAHFVCSPLASVTLFTVAAAILARRAAVHCARAARDRPVGPRVRGSATQLQTAMGEAAR
ncbi:MFS transporter [Streptomyces sp. NBC_01023]|uniref:MFS transporter n=1 Tax=Streptomyces sp. NBC_01023 TaxID=2903724 RepID=UPI00386AECC0|nr:MFS transporter [Streptomyces sp. NBC_01023]